MSVVQMAVYLNSETYKKFKIKCVQEGVSIKSVIIEFCENFVEDMPDEPSPRNDKTNEAKEE